MFDCHVHTRFSVDSRTEPEEACEKAISIGLDGLTFTDHMDIDFPDLDMEFMIDFEKYHACMDAIKDRYRGKLKVLKGIEIGIQPHVIDATAEVIKKNEFDYVLASVHIIDGMDPYKKKYYEGKSKFEAYDRYLRQVLFMVNHFDDFDVVGHLDYIIRNGDYEDRTLIYSDHADVLDMIFKCLISKGKGIEVNTSSYKDSPGVVTAGYDIQLLKRYRELGGEIVVLGSDAHSPEYIGYKFENFKEILLQAGFRYIAHFESRKPVLEIL